MRNKEILKNLIVRIENLEKLTGICFTSEGEGFMPTLNANWKESELSIMKEKIELILEYLKVEYKVIPKKFISREAQLKRIK